MQLGARIRVASYALAVRNTASQVRRQSDAIAVVQDTSVLYRQLCE
jgi:hypothetical protein